MRHISANSPDANYRTGGFTLIELVMIIPPLMIFLALTISLLISMVTENSVSQAKASIAYDQHATLDNLTRDISGTIAFMQTKEAAFSDAYGPNSTGASWSHIGTSYTNRVIIAKTIATTASPYADNRSVVYINSYGCNQNKLTSNPPLTTNTIYFVRNGTLYRRTLTNTSLATCGSAMFQRQSCPPEASIANPCQAHDLTLLKGVTHFTVNYYDKDGAYLDVYTVPALMVDATTVDITIRTNQKISGEDIKYDTNIKISKLSK